MAVIVFNDLDNSGDVNGAEFVNSYATLQDAVAAAVTGQSLYIQNGTYTIGATLVINKQLNIYGQSEAGVILNASTASNTGIWATADGIKLQNFTINGPLAANGGTYGLKVGPDSGVATDTTDNVVLSNITVQGSGRSEFDINGVNGGTFTNLTANGLNTAGVGLAITDSANLTINGLTTSGNNWGSVAIFDGSAFTLPTANIAITGHVPGTGEAQVYAQTIPGGQTPNALLDAVAINGAQSWVVYVGGTGVGFATESAANAYAGTLPAKSYAIENPAGQLLVHDGMSIQQAVNAARNGDTILIDAGTYREQVLINGKTLTITAADGAKLEMPDNAAIQSSGGYNAGITVIGGNVTIDNLDVDGRNQGNGFDNQTFAAVAFQNADGVYRNGAITGFRDTGILGAQHGYGIIARSTDGGTHNVEVANADIGGFQKNGIDARGSGLVVDLHDNRITGVGSTTEIAQNGIVLVNAASGTVSANTINDIAYTGTNPGVGTGVLLFSAGNNVVVTNNTIDLAGAGSAGIVLESTNAGTITGNAIADAATGLQQSGSFVTAVNSAASNTYAANVATNFLFDPADAGTTGFTVSGTEGIDELDGTAGADSFTGGAGADTIEGRGGIDTATYAGTLTTADFTFTGGKWHVAGDTLEGVEIVTDGSNNVFRLVGADGDDGYASIQAAVNAAGTGNFVLIAPGNYIEGNSGITTYAGPGQNTGLYINTAGLTLQGYSQTTGAAITTGAAAQTDGPVVIAKFQAGFGANHWIDRDGDGVTIQGLHLQAGPQTNNKLLEIWADDVTVNANFIDVYEGGYPTGTNRYAWAIYFNDDGGAADEIASYTVSNNVLTEGVAITNGAGNPGAAGDQRIVDNAFIGDGRYDTISLSGNVPASGYLFQSVGYPTITGNTIDGNATPYLLRAADDNAAALPTAATVAQFLSDNTDADNSYAYALTATGELRAAVNGPTSRAAVFNSIDTLNLGLDATADDVFSGQRVHAQAGDTIVVQSAGATASEIMVEDLHVRATASSADLNLTLATAYADTSAIAGGGVKNVTLDDHATGAGADVDVTGNALANTIIGNSGANTLDGGDGNDVLRGGAGNDNIVGGAGGGDVLVLSAAPTAISIASGAGSVTSADGTDTFSGIEAIRAGDTFYVYAGMSIQAAIDAAPDGATIIIAEGTYVEQVTIEGRENLTIQAATGAVVAVQSPAIAVVNGEEGAYDVASVISVNNSVGIAISGIAIDGAFAGDTTAGSNGWEIAGLSYLASSGSVSNVTIDNVSNSPANGLFGLQHGVGLLIDSNGVTGLAVTVTGTTITDFQKTGVYADGIALTFTGNTITGIGATSLIGQNGMQVARASGLIDDNDITGFGYVAAPGDDTYASGLIVYEPAGALTISNNDVTGAAGGQAAGLDISDTSTTTGAVIVSGNDFAQLQYGVVAYTYEGGATGPGLDHLNLTGNTYTDITGEGVFFTPESSGYSTANGFAVDGTTFADTLAGSAGADSFDGLAGDDSLTGNGGDDTLAGGLGDDTATYAGAASGYDVEGVDTDGDGRIDAFTTVEDTNAGNGDEGKDTLTGIERLSFDGGATVYDLDDAVQLFDAGGGFVASFGTIQAAIDAADTGYVIDVAAGVYDEDLNIDKAVTIRGAQDGVAFAGRNAATGVGETTILGDSKIRSSGNLTIDGVRFLNDATTTGNGPGNPALQIAAAGSGGVKTVTNTIFWSTVTGGANGVDDRAFSTEVLSNTDILFTANLISGSSQAGFNTASWGRGVWFDGGDGVDLIVSGSTLQYVRSAFNADLTGTATFTATGNLIDTATTAFSVGVDADGFVPTDNDFSQVGTEFNLRNAGGFTLDLETAVDAVSGTGGNEVVVATGGAGNDTILGTAGADYLDDNAAGASFESDTTADTDTLDGRGGDDTLVAEFGDDTLIGGSGNNALSGGAGDDTAVVVGSYTVVEGATGWTATSAGAVDTLTDVEIVTNGTARTLLVGNGGYDSLAAAMADALDGDTILIADGPYAGDATIDKAVTIKGAQAGVSGTATRGAESVLAGQLTITDDVTIDGVQILNATGPSGAFVGISVQGDVDVTVRNSVFFATLPLQAGMPAAGGTDRAILLGSAAIGSVTIENNAFTGAQQVATDKYSTANWTTAIWSDGGTASLAITGNRFDNVRTGLNLDGYNNAVTSVTGNLFTDSGSGVSIGTAVTTAITGISGNTFTNVDTDFNLQNVTVGQSFNLAATGNVGGGSGADAIINVLGTQGADTLGGGAGSERLTANNGDDRIGASAGDDTIAGGGGNDTYVLGGVWTDYDVTANTDGSYTIVSTAEGTDTVSGVEFVELGGQSYAIGTLPDDAPDAVNDDNLPTAGDPTDPGDFLKEDVDSLAVGNVLSNDQNTDAVFGDTLRVISITGWTTAAVPSDGTAALVNSDFGILSMKADGTYRYEMEGGRTALNSLAEGQVATQTFTYVVADNAGNTDTATLTLTVIGTNDAPVVLSGPGAGNVLEAGDLDNGTDTPGNPTASGTLLASDPDSGTTLTWSGNATGTYGSFAIGTNGAWTYTLDNLAGDTQKLFEGQTVTETFTATVSDGTATAQQIVTITITGANDAPVVTAATATATEDTGSVPGSLAGNASDVDTGATETFALVGTPSWITLAADGSYSIITSDPLFQSLAAGATGVFTANYTVTDDKDAVTPGTLTVTVTGTNDAPVLTAVFGSPKELYESQGLVVDNFAAQTGTLTVNDVDNPDTVTGEIVGYTVTFNGQAPSGATQTAIATGLTTGQGGTGSALSFGTVSPNGTAAALSWAYDPGAVNLKTLSEEDTVTITYTVKANDGDASSTATQQIVINVHGVNELINGNGDDNTITGTSNADDIYSGDGDDAVNAGGGNDDVYGGAGDDSVLGGGGNDEVYGGDGDDSLDGASGADTLFGGGGDDMLSGGSDNDTFYVGDGNAVVNGGSGTDTLVLDGAWTSYAISKAGSNTYSIEGAEGEIVASFVENFVFAGNGSGQTGPFTAAQILNDAPVAGDDLNAAYTGNVTGNDTDPDATLGDTKTITGIRAGTEAAGGSFGTVTGAPIVGTYGTLTINADGSYSYVVDANDPQTLALGSGSATEAFTYRVADAKGLTDTATLSFTVTGTNTPPVAVDDIKTTAEDTTLSFPASDLTGNDTDANGNPLTVTAVGNAINGTVTLSGGTITFTPAGNYNGAASFDYTLSDGTATDTGTVNITVTPVNDAPVANPNSYIAIEDTILTGSASVLSNDNDVDGDTLNAVLVSGTSNGTLTLNPDGNFTYTPAANFAGTDSFTYRASDGTALSAPTTVTITVAPVNDAPVANDDSITVAEDASVSGSVAGNDSDIDGDALTYALTGAAAAGLTFSSDGSYTFDASNAAYQSLGAGDTGLVTVGYTASDATLSDGATLSVTVTGVNDAATITGDATQDIAEDGSGTVSGDLDVVDPDTGESVFEAVAPAALEGAYGDFTFDAATGAYSYTLDSSLVQGLDDLETLTDTLTVSSVDGTDSETIIVTINGANDAPVAGADALAATEDTVATFQIADLIGNDTDADGEPLTLGAVFSGTGGTVSRNTDGTIRFDPASNFTGTATFTYEVSDGTVTTIGTATVTVAAVNDAPIGSADAILPAGTEDQPYTVTDTDLLMGFSDVENDTLSVVGLTASDGVVVADGSGGYTITPTPDFNGTMTLTYQVSDGLASIAATQSYQVTPVNDAPVAVDDALTATEDTPLVIAAGTLTGNDQDVDGDTLIVTAVGGAVNGTVDLAGGVITFTPDANYAGPASFTYTVSDGTLSSTATVNISVAAVNDAPVANPDSLTVDEDTPTTFAASALIGNDSDVDGGPLTLVSVTSGTGGSVSLNGDGTFTFAPATNFNGTATFSYVVSDGTTTSNGSASVTVNAVNDAPTGPATGALPAGTEDTAYDVSETDLLAGFTDVDSTNLSVVNLSASNGSVTESGGVYTITPTTDYNGPVTLTYQVTDGVAMTAPVTRSYTLAAVNDAPVANDDALNATEDQAVTFTAAQLTGNDSDVDTANASLVIASVNSGTNGTAVLNADGTVTFTPAANFNGIATFTYTVSDGLLTSAPATATVSVAAVNDAPTGAPDYAFPAGTEDTSYVVQKADLLSGFSDADGDTLTATITAVSNATFIDNGASYTITPNANYNGAVTISYLVSDGTTAVPATQTLSFAAVNDAPVAVADTLASTEDVVATFTVAQLLANDSDVDTGDTLSIVSVANGTGGAVSLSGGVITFTPAANFNGPATFTYQLSDGTTTTSGNATINVAAANDVAVITGTRTGSVTEDGTLTTAGDLDVADPDTGEAKFAGVSGTRAGTYGTYTFDVDTGVWSYQLNNADPAVQALNTGQTLTDMITVQSVDGSASTTLQVTINGADEPLTGIVGTNGDDNLNGTAAAENMYGLDGNDTFNGSAGADHLFGGNGTDTANYGASASAVTVSLASGTGIGGDAAGDTYNSIENVIGSAFADTLVGDGNANSLSGGAGNDTMSGGAGDDSYDVDSATDSVTEAAGEGIDTVRTTVTTYTLGNNLENLVYTGSAAFTGTGNALANAITGGGGADKLDGRAGADTMTGLGGNDIYTVDDAGDVVVEASVAGTDTVNASINYTLTANVENLTLIGAALDATGNGENNVLKGTTGNNRLDGGAGADNMAGFQGDDTYVVDNTADIVNETDASGYDTIETTLNTLTLRTFVEKLVFTGTGNFTGIGNVENNTIIGGSGNDKLDGRTGADSMTGGAGDDSYAVDNVGDVIIELAGGGYDDVFVLVADYIVSDNVEKVTMGGTARNLTAGAGNTLILGNGLVNRIDGGAGADTMTGYSGNDTFVFQRGQAGGDIVTDFAGAGATGGDVIELRGYGTIATGASIARIGTTDSYLITADASHGGGTETITLTGVFGLTNGDVVFM